VTYALGEPGQGGNSAGNVGATGLKAEVNGCAVPSEACNGLDDDWDGETDEGLGSTTCGVGACAVTVPNCAGGKVQTCTPGDPTAEVCNGLDDDCDGETDEDPAPCPGGAPCKDGHCGCFPACGADKVCKDGTCVACSAWVTVPTCWPYAPNHATFNWGAPSSSGPCKMECKSGSTVLYSSTSCSGSVTLSWPFMTTLMCTLEAPEGDGTCTASHGCA